MSILFVRHGKSTANAANTVGEPSTPLTGEGVQQAEAIGQKLKSQNVRRIVCSPLIRAQQTAEIIAHVLGLPLGVIEIIPELSERYMGSLQGKPKKHETAYFYENDTENDFESRQVLIDRMSRALTKIKNIASKTEGTIVVVGHAVSGFYLLQVAKGKKKYQEFEPFHQMDNASFVELKLD